MKRQEVVIRSANGELEIRARGHRTFNADKDDILVTIKDLSKEKWWQKKKQPVEILVDREDWDWFVEQLKGIVK
ncbi:MAG: hypothetical protein PHW73_04115 [Atribacterota bacterium]|nr:hypothetical protein [Atribacterota bacterium]